MKLCIYVYIASFIWDSSERPDLHNSLKSLGEIHTCCVSERDYVISHFAPHSSVIIGDVMWRELEYLVRKKRYEGLVHILGSMSPGTYDSIPLIAAQGDG